MMAFDSLQQAVLEGDADEAARLVQEHLDEGAEALDILDNGLIAAMDEVGARFSAGDLFIPEMLIAAEAMQAGLSLLKPLLVSEDATGRGIVIIGAVKGDLHDIGKNLVALMLEGAGFTVIDLGADVAPEAFVEAAAAHNADIVGMSALLVTTMPQMTRTIEKIRAAGLDARAMIGGAPVTQAYADEIKADGYASDAPGAVALCKSMLA
jgi:5-methyltetrahydrofolate--homocysteine methyltransferase